MFTLLVETITENSHETVSAYEIEGAGCLVKTNRTITINGSLSSSEALTFVPNVRMVEVNGVKGLAPTNPVEPLMDMLEQLKEMMVGEELKS
jgi:hypothetical protein